MRDPSSPGGATAVAGPLVCLSQSALGFNWLLLGERSAQSLEISNISDVPAHYQFDLDGRDSVFSVDHPCGVLEGQASLSLMVTFRPSHPIIYYRRVACLVHHQVPGQYRKGPVLDRMGNTLLQPCWSL